MKNSKIFTVYGSLIFFALDVLALFTASDLDGNYNHGDIFDADHAWQFGILGSPLLICGLASAVLGIKKAKRYMKIIPIIGFFLCLLLTYFIYYDFLVARSPNLWGA